MKVKIAGTLFLACWLLSACGIDTCLDSPTNLAIEIVAAGVALASAWSLSR